MRRTIVTFMLLLSSTALMARTIAVVNGENIDSSVVERQISTMRAEMGGKFKDTPQLRNSITNAAIVHAVIVQEARRLRLDQGEEFKRIVNQALGDARRTGEDRKPGFELEYRVFRENLMEQAFYVDVLRRNPVSEADLRREYNDMVSFYKRSSEILIGQIITRDVASAREVINDLKRGIPFTDVARRHTIDPEGRRTGGIPPQYINLNDLKVAAPSLYDLIKDIPKGKFTSEPLNSGDTFAVFYIADIRGAKVPSFEAMRKQLQRQLGDDRVNKAIDGLMRRARIQRFDR